MLCVFLSNLLRKELVPEAQDLDILSPWEDKHYMGLRWGRSHALMYPRASLEHCLAWSSVPMVCFKKRIVLHPIDWQGRSQETYPRTVCGGQHPTLILEKR